MKKFFAVLLLLGHWSISGAQAKEVITVAAAADLKYAMEEIAGEFRKVHPGASVTLIFGSSGKFYTQIRQDAPFDLYFSADINYPRMLRAEGLAASEVRSYAFGRIVLWGVSTDAGKLTLADLASPAIRRVALANPRHAPYGKRAEEALRAAGLWDKIQPKLVFGENVAQAAQFVDSGAADVGIVALSLALTPSLAARGRYFLIPENLHEPLEQGYIVTRRAAGNGLAQAFAEHFEKPSARAILHRYGFVLPGEK